MAPKHKKAYQFIQNNLFVGLTSFKELETRISNLPEQERGDAFEVFAEAYFNTQQLSQTQEVWSQVGAIPESVKSELGLPDFDMGIDGLFKTHDGQYHAYQVKYRTNRLSLSWDELSTFMGLSDKSDKRVLFTNSSDIADVMNARSNFYSIKGNDLDKLEVADFQAIENWLKTGKILRVKKTPRPHQTEAIKDIVKEFSVNDRATAVMACGTGKTLVALWAAQELQAQTILVLLPSLSLVRQTLHDWARENNWDNFNYLCICSDETVIQGEDEIKIPLHDLDFPVTTQKEAVIRFLQDQKKLRKIIFSTYQSCNLIPKNFTFDFGVFDEAHKTAGREGTNFSYALKDENISIAKRLFMTATPRHYDVRKVDKEGEHRLVFSMDDAKTYGQICHKLSFAHAAEQNIICKYKVIISLVESEQVSPYCHPELVSGSRACSNLPTSAHPEPVEGSHAVLGEAPEINRDLLKRSDVVIKGDPIKAQRVANLLALTNAVERYGVKRVFTFHSSVNLAESFTSDSGAGISTFLPDFKTFHVNGAMKTSKREAHMKEFREAPKAVMSNARCLTEGVDVPAVDMVAFLSPKKSQIDIVQATGRAMRKSEGKEYGYILIPIFLEISNNEDINQALEQTKFDDIWNVLQTLQEHDESLCEIIRQMREDIGRVGGFDDSKLRDKVEVIGPELQLSVLRAAITTKLVERLGSTWDERFGELCKYKEEHGDCNVPTKSFEYPLLGMWVGVQRHLYNSKNKRMTSKRISKLNSIGFVWDPISVQWEKMFLELSRYKEINMHCNVAQRDGEYLKLGTWVAEQRKDYKKGEMSLYRIEKLTSLDFVFDVFFSNWEQMYSLLCKFKNEHGHCNVLRSFSGSLQLSSWVSETRKAYKRNKISRDRIEKLEEIGFCWSPLDEYQCKMIKELCEFKDKNGHCNVPQQYNISTLGKWVIAQRVRYKKGKLAPEIIDKLNFLGFDWNPIDTVWETMYLSLCEFKNEFGHCIVPKKSLKLGNWVGVQRNLHSKNRLEQRRIEKLNEVGFIWNSFDTKWEECYNGLVEFKVKNGHCNVPCDYEDYSLFRWVGTQRLLYKKNQVSAERITKLNKLDFCWDDNLDQSWNTKFAELCEFKKMNGHCNIMLRDIENPILGRWANMQRGLYKKGKLSKDRIHTLSEIGFVFDPFTELWEKRFLELCDFKSIYGHCNVPATYAKNPSLGSWVRKQRIEYRCNNLSADRVLRLNQMGLSWNPYDAVWDETFLLLSRFKSENGHCEVPRDNSLSEWVRTQRKAFKEGKMSRDRIKKLDELGFVWTTR